MLNNNKFSGITADSFRNAHLVILTLHSNKLTGPAPSFINFTKLNTLTLFGNELRGRLQLPSVALQLTNLLVHNNRPSLFPAHHCVITYPVPLLYM